MRSPHLSSRAADTRLIEKLLSYLTPRERDALLLRWGGMTNGEIAAALGVSCATVGMRFHRARRRLAPWPRLQALLSAPRRSRRG